MRKQPFDRWATRSLVRRRVVALFVLLLTALVLAVAVQADDEGGRDDPTYPAPVILKQTVGPAGINIVVQIPPWQDSYIASGQPSTNYGSSTALNLGYAAGTLQAMRLLMQFNLSSMPPNAVINSATLQMYQFGSTPSNDSPMGFQGQYMNAAWNESTVTWNNANYLGGTFLPVGSLSSSNGWKSGNVTDIVRAWHSGSQSNHGVIITGDEGPDRNRSRNLYSRQQTNSVPYIVVDFTTPCDTVAPTATVNSLPGWSSEDFGVSWSGFDSAQSGCTPSGIAYFDVQYKKDNNDWVNWKSQTTSTTATFNGGVNGSVYQFRARATDKAGNVQNWGDAQAHTTVVTNAFSRVLPIDPPVIRSTNAVTDSFEVTWESVSAPASTITKFDIWVQYNNGAWELWNSFPGTQFSATFNYLDMGLGDGFYYFESVATNSQNQVEPRAGIKESLVVVDLAGILKPSMYFPIHVK